MQCSELQDTSRNRKCCPSVDKNGVGGLCWERDGEEVASGDGGGKEETGQIRTVE